MKRSGVVIYLIFLVISLATPFHSSISNVSSQDQFNYDQVPEISWNRTFTGEGDQSLHKIILTTDGDFVIAGSRSIFPPSGDEFFPAWKAWLIQINPNGEEIWNDTFGYANNELACNCGVGSYSEIEGIVSLLGGGYTFTYANYFSGELEGQWLTRMDQDNNVLWNQSLGNLVNGRFMTKTTEEGYLVTSKQDGVRNEDGLWVKYPYVFTKFDPNGNKEFNLSLELSRPHLNNIADFEIHDVILTSEGGYIFAGGIFVDNSLTSMDMWLLKTNSNGEFEWSTTFPQYPGIRTGSVIETNDGGIMLLGQKPNFPGKDESLLLKIDETGILQWSQSLEGTVSSIMQTSDGGFILLAHEDNLDRSASGKANEASLLKTDSQGNIVWKEVIPGLLGGDGGKKTFLLQTSDGGIILAGSPSSSVTDNRYDIYVAKLGGIKSINLSETIPDISSNSSETFIYIAGGLTVISTLLYSTIYIIRKKKLVKALKLSKIDNLIFSSSKDFELSDYSMLALISGIKKLDNNYESDIQEDIPQELMKYRYLMHPIRLTIMKLLDYENMMVSSSIRTHLGTSWGEYRTHLKSLEEKGYIMISDEFNEEGSVIQVVHIEEVGRLEYQTLFQLLQEFTAQQSPYSDISSQNPFDSNKKNLYPKWK